MEEIETYIAELLNLAVNPEGEKEAAYALRKILKEVPLDEQGVLQTYHHILENKIPEYGPYPS